MPTSPPLIYRRVHRVDVGIGPYEGAGVRAVEDAGPYEGAGVRAVEDAGPYKGVQVDDLLTKADNHNIHLAHSVPSSTVCGTDQCVPYTGVYVTAK